MIKTIKISLIKKNQFSILMTTISTDFIEILLKQQKVTEKSACQ